MRGLAGEQEQLIEKYTVDRQSAEKEKGEASIQKHETEKRRETCEQELGSLYRSLSENNQYLERERAKEEIKRGEAEWQDVKGKIAVSETKEGELKRLRGDMRQLGVFPQDSLHEMDEDHLKATLEFTRRLGLQLIMATPKERAEYIIPHVESCWLVLKEPQTGDALLIDFHQEIKPRESNQSEAPAPMVGSYVQDTFPV